MPAATPLPRGPSVLILDNAADLLTGPGCPVCRYAAEVSDRYLAWFALEGHAQPTTVTQVCKSLGMCPRHTRRLMSQPGAAIRLTALYRYVVTAARDRLAGRHGRIAACPACEHDNSAASRALDTLLEGLADDGVRHTYRDVGGLCLPHLDAAAAAGHRRSFTWLADTMRETIAARPAGCGWLAGTDHDAETRAVLRRALPPTGSPEPASCAPCLAESQAERNALARVPGLVSDGPNASHVLCAGHLADAATAAGPGGIGALIAWQAGCETSRLAGGRTRWTQANRRRRDRPGACIVCRARHDTRRRWVAGLVSTAQLPASAASLCVRHHLAVSGAAPRLGQTLARDAVARASLLIGELADAFERTARARSYGDQVPESSAWRRAAAFLDGGVFGGCPPRLR